MKKLFFIVFALMLTLSSCIKDDGPNFYYVPLQIESAELPDSFELNETYEIRVTFNRPDGCTSFGGFDVTPHDLTTRNVVVIGTKRTDAEACTEAIEQESRTFNFRVIHAQTYVFRFWHGQDEDGNQEYFEVEVPVN